MSISGASRNIPMDWKEKSAHIIARVGCDQTLHTDDNGIFIPPILYQYYSNTDRIPVYIDMNNNYTWGERNTGGGGMKLVLEIKRKLILQYNYPVQR